MSWKLNRMDQLQRGSLHEGGHLTLPLHASPFSHQAPEKDLTKSSAGKATSWSARPLRMRHVAPR